MCPAAPVREVDVRAEHLLRPGALDEELHDFEHGARQIGGQDHGGRRAEHVPDPAQAHGRPDDSRAQQDEVVASVRVERVVEPVGPVAEAVHGEHQRVVERLEDRHRRSERDHSEHERGQARRPPAQTGERVLAPA